MRISDPRTFGSKLITELQLDAVSGILTTNYETFIKNVLKGTKGAEAPVSYGYAYLDANGKIDIYNSVRLAIFLSNSCLNSLKFYK